MMKRLLLVAAIAGCGGPTTPPTEVRSSLRRAIETPVESAEQAAELSRLVEAALEDDVFRRMRRSEVEDAVGRGDDCARHPRCQQNGFADNDWFYEVGQPIGGFPGPVPIMIIGFDREGRADKAWNLRVH